MYYDLAQIAKAKGIHRILGQLAILSRGPVGDEGSKHLPENPDGKVDGKSNVSHEIEKDKVAI